MRQSDLATSVSHDCSQHRRATEWDEDKNTANILKHSVSFEEAATAFADPRHLVLDDGATRTRYSTLARYAAALGGVLEVTVTVDGRRYLLDL